MKFTISSALGCYLKDFKSENKSFFLKGKWVLVICAIGMPFLAESSPSPRGLLSDRRFANTQLSGVSGESLVLKSLGAITLVRGPGSPRDRIWEKKPWQWRGRNALGAAPQSFIPPIFMEQEGQVLVATLGGGLSAVKLKTGHELWRFEIPVGVASAPDLRNGFVYFAGMDGRVRKVRADSGTLVWETYVGAESVGGVRVSGNQVFVTTADDALWSLDEPTGQTRWTYKRPAPRGSVYWSLRGSAIPLVDADGLRLFAGFSDGVFVCLEASSGKTLWERKFERPGRFKDADQWAQLSADGKILLVPLVDGDLLGLKALDGSTLWTLSGGGGAPPLVDEDGAHFFVVTVNGEVQKVATADTRMVWEVKLPGGQASLPISLGKDFFALSHSTLGFVVLSKATGVVVFSEPLGPGLLAPPAYDGHEVLVLSPRNQLYRFLVPKPGVKI